MPWSTSSSAPCAPSNSRFLPSCWSANRLLETSRTMGARAGARAMA
ncbi:Uncharacterised protein [Bordetella pertussis]|nr:Uncharacterised protein [Bordetella pertussis]